MESKLKGSRKLCVFCGSNIGKSPAYKKMVEDLAVQMQKKELGLVYGGASIGLMGELADAVLGFGGEVIGVIPESLMNAEVAHSGLTKLHVVTNMHERKYLMYEESQAFMALPGGFGTLDELCEILTWSQLGYHEKSIGLLNSQGFYDHLINHFKRCVDDEFVSQEHFSRLKTAQNPSQLLDKLFAGH